MIRGRLLKFCLKCAVLFLAQMLNAVVGLYIEPPDSCYIGFKTPKPSNNQYAEYVEGKASSHMIEFPIELCTNQKDVSTIALTVLDYDEKVGIAYVEPLPDIISLAYSSAASLEEAQQEHEKYFIINSSNTDQSNQHKYMLQIIFPKLTVDSNCTIEIKFSSTRGVESYSATSSWMGKFYVYQKALIGRVPQHTIQSVVNGELRSEIICGKVMGKPTPDVTWTCQGNSSFWIRETKDGPKKYGPHTKASLSLYEFGDDDRCVGDARYELVCTVENRLKMDGKSYKWNDSKVINTTQVIKAVDSDKAACKDAEENEAQVCRKFLESPRRIQYNSTHKLSSFIDILNFSSTHVNGDASICETAMQSLVCSFFASDCKARGSGLNCRSECQRILEHCTNSPSLPVNFCNYFPADPKQCIINFIGQLNLIDNLTVAAYSNNSAYSGSLSLADNQTCEPWNRYGFINGFILAESLEGNYCRAIRAPENNNLYCLNKNQNTVQCWPEKPPPETEPPPSDKENCDVVCRLQTGLRDYWKVMMTVIVAILATGLLLLLFVYCCCCRRQSVRMVAQDASSFPGMKLRQNPMYNASNTQSRVIPNTPDPSLGMGQPDVRSNHQRFPNVMQASRNRYVPTPENSLGRSGAPTFARFQGVPPRGHSPAAGISTHPVLPMARPVGPGPFGYQASRDANPLAKFEYDRNKIQYIEDIGSGAFGYVFRAKAPGLGRKDIQMSGSADHSSAGIEVAVKMLKDDATEEQMADFVNEAKLMSSFNHPNIIKLLGVCSVGKPFCLLLEYMKNRDLSDFLRKNGPESDLDVKERISLTIADLILICQQVASGMSYISEKNYIHRDLATRNCLVSESMAVKISDFGLSQFIGTKDCLHVDDNDAIPIRWIAPEALHSNRYTKQSDVWAFGVLLWEVFSFAQQPYVSMANIEDVVDFVTNGNHLDKPHHTPDDIYEVMCQCWNMEPTKRPHFRSLYEILDNLLKRYTSSQSESFC